MKRYFLALVVVVLLASLLLAGCNGEEETTSTTTTTTSSTSTTTTSGTPTTTTSDTPTTTTTSTPSPTTTEPVYGGTLRIISSTDPTVLGYPVESAGRATFFWYNCLERMIVYAPDVWENQTYQGCLATSYSFENDMKTWTFNLREGVLFQDGTPWNAEAAQWNCNLWKDSGASVTFNKMISADVIDEYTLQLNFESPVNGFEVELATRWYMISPTAFENAGATEEERIDWARGNPVGTGPFKLVEAVLGDHVTYERFDDYWGGKPYLEGVEYLIVPDHTVSKAMMETGEADMYALSGFKETLELEAMDGFWARYCGKHTPEGIWPSAREEESVYYDKRVREALEYALNREAIVNAISLGSPEISILYQKPYPGDPAYREGGGRSYDPDKARELLAEAGYPNGFETTIYVNAVTQRWGDAALIIQGMLSEVNIDVTIEYINPGQFMTYLLFSWPPNTILFAGLPNEPIPYYVASRDFACTPPEIPKWLTSTATTPELCALWGELQAATSPESAMEVYVRLAHQAEDDCIGILLMDWPDTAVFADYVHTDWISYSTKVWNSNLTWMEEH